MLKWAISLHGSHRSSQLSLLSLAVSADNSHLKESRIFTSLSHRVSFVKNKQREGHRDGQVVSSHLISREEIDCK